MHNLSLLVGLGNPGFEYADTRHNAGFMVIDELCQRLRVRMRAGPDFKEGRSEEILLLKPMTYMNNSGDVLEDVIRRTGLSLDRCLVIVDDVHLPLGAMRLRPGGSHGGHNGLRSIIFRLNTDQFARLRLGIGTSERPGSADLSEFVLAPFEGKERTALRGMIERASEAAMEYARSGIQVAMKKFNT